MSPGKSSSPVLLFVVVEDDKIYEDAKQLRYGHLMILVDQDHDDFIPPIVKASTKGTKNVLPFYTMAEYEAWKKSLGHKATEYEIKYCKGLGTTETEEVIKYFADLDNYTKEFVWVDDEDGDAIVLAFDKTKIGQRKYWLRGHQ
nr:DNA topoisomerase 2 [Tanacetum cinerariifolium]